VVSECFGTTFAEAEKNEGSSERDEAMVGRSHAGGDYEEAASMEWAEKCLSIHFKCLWLFSLETSVTTSWFSLGVQDIRTCPVEE
jgi:hypothetical protein